MLEPRKINKKNANMHAHDKTRTTTEEERKLK